MTAADPGTETDRPRLMTVEDLAGYLGVPKATLYRWNSRGTGPKRLVVGRHVRYRSVDVERWLDDRSVRASDHPDRRGELDRADGGLHRPGE